jgi:hypothetical protein
MHLILTFFWFLVGSVLLAWQALHPEDSRFSIWGSQISMGWVALLLGLYNLARWWSSHSAVVRAREVASQQRPPATYRTEEPPNPDFDFSKPVPQAEGEKSETA